MSEEANEPVEVGLDWAGLTDVTQQVVRRQSKVIFSGFLVREDEHAIYIADPQGTWVVSREDIAYVEEWNVDLVPPATRCKGNPVTVAVRDGATIFEIRPWTLSLTPGGMGPEARKVVDRVFSLGGAPLPITDRGVAGEEHMAELERSFARRLGWNPANPSGSPFSGNADMKPRSVSKTINIYDGFTDVDEPF